MKLVLNAPCITHASVIPIPGKALPELKLNFYSTTAKAEGLVLQTVTESGKVLDTVVLSVSPKDGKIAASRRYEPIDLDFDKKEG